MNATSADVCPGCVNQSSILFLAAQMLEPDTGDLSRQERKFFDLRNRGVHILFHRQMGQHDDVDLILAFPRLLLHHGVDRDVADRRGCV